ncbi:MAG TPA: FAD binding domain-containing protein [Acidimicrobiales bacterium]|nr:FAD binding domain-containing protein [Acidimicrobiales bacterium]
MKLPPFEYLRASSAAEAVSVLSADEDSKVLAGGQSLLPLMALRLAHPTVLVDIAALDLAGVEVVDGPSHIDASSCGGPVPKGGKSIRLGAMVRQSVLESEPVVAETVPLLAAAARYVGHPATRNLGTLGGSLAHADPAAELPAVAVALGAVAVVVGPAGPRHLACSLLAEGYFTTSLAPDEILTEICFPAAGPRHGAAWCEWSPRVGDFAEAGVGVAVDLDGDGAITAIVAAACSVAPVPLDLGTALADAGVVGATSLPDPLLRAAARAAESAASGSPGDKAELTGLLAARAVARAFQGARKPIAEVQT